VQKTTDEDVAKILQKSLVSTSKGLKLFANSLQTSGLEEAIPKYRELQTVLTQQRLWSENKGRKELAPLWKEIAQQSDKIYQTFSSLADTMKILRTIDSLSNPQQASPLRAKILLAIFQPKPVSLQYLTTTLKFKKETIATEMAKLKKEGLVETRGKGNGISYRPTKQLLNNQMK